MGVQELYLMVLAVVGYGLFLIIQRPTPFYKEESYECILFGSYIAAIIVTLIFWGMLSHTLSCLFRTMWAGIGGCLILWVFTNSRAGDLALGKWNLFSYTFRNIENSGDFTWICGKLACVVFCLAMAGMIPKIIRKRG